MPVTGDTIVTLADGSRSSVCHIQPGMKLANGFKIVTIVVQRFTGWLYIIQPHFITTGTTLIGDDRQVAKNIATKRIYATADVYDFTFDEHHQPVYTYETHPQFWSCMLSGDAVNQMIYLPAQTEHDPDSKVYHRKWDAETKAWHHELANYQLS